MFGAISEKFRTFDMQIIFAIPPISHFRRWLGEFFSLFQSYEISITLSISSLGKSKTIFSISRQSLTKSVYGTVLHVDPESLRRFRQTRHADYVSCDGHYHLCPGIDDNVLDVELESFRRSVELRVL